MTKATGILRIQSFAARRSAPVSGVTVVVTGGNFTVSRITDEEGNAADIAINAPSCSYSLDENNTTVMPYATCNLMASKPGYRPVTIEGIQIFSDQITLAGLEMIPETARGADVPDEVVQIPVHALFSGKGGSGPAPENDCTSPAVLPAVIIPKTITVHLGAPASSAKNVTVSFRDYIANVASSEVYPTWVTQNNPNLLLSLLRPFRNSTRW